MVDCTYGVDRSAWVEHVEAGRVEAGHVEAGVHEDCDPVAGALELESDDGEDRGDAEAGGSSTAGAPIEGKGLVAIHDNIEPAIGVVGVVYTVFVPRAGAILGDAAATHSRRCHFERTHTVTQRDNCYKAFSFLLPNLVLMQLTDFDRTALLQALNSSCMLRIVPSFHLMSHAYMYRPSGSIPAWAMSDGEGVKFPLTGANSSLAGLRRGERYFVLDDVYVQSMQDSTAAATNSDSADDLDDDDSIPDLLVPEEMQEAHVRPGYKSKL
ncbi:hypothetical protein DFH09DRAFT_1101829 [Mycena vulgaris]|nr:hypothetical protein DFH09DRAFT_1101829 [Mycena vulgaris]